jgi:hypothetical protein
VYNATFMGIGFREFSDLSFTHDGQPGLTSGFGTYFINNWSPGIDPVGSPGGYSQLSAYGADGSLLKEQSPLVTEPNGITFLGFVTVDGATGRPVPAIGEVTVLAGRHSDISVYLDNFAFSTPMLTPVPEANACVLLGVTLLGSVALVRLRYAGVSVLASRLWVHASAIRQP